MNTIPLGGGGDTRWISGHRATGRTTELLNEASRYQEANPEAVTYVFTHTADAAHRYTMDMVMERIKGWIESDPECEYPLDPQRTIVDSIGVWDKRRGRRFHDCAAFIDDYDIVADRWPDLLRYVIEPSGMTVAAVVVEDH